MMTRKKKRNIILAIIIFAAVVMFAFGISKDDETGDLMLVVKHDPFSDFVYGVCDDHVVLIFCNENRKDTLYIPDTILGKPVTKIGDYCFYKDAYEYVDYATKYRDDYEHQFHTVYLGENIEVIGKKAFKRCRLLKQVLGDNTLRVVDQSAFGSCAELEIFEPKLVRVEERVFSYCRSLKSIDTSSDITYIGGRAFEECDNLTDIGEQSNLTYVGRDAFNDSGLESFHGSKDTEFGYSVFGHTPYLISFDNFVLNGIQMKYTYDGKKPYIKFSQGLTSIDLQCVHGDVTNLEEIYIPDTVTDLKGYVLNDSDKKVTYYIPDSVTSIGYEDDDGWNFLSIDDEAEKIVTTEGSYAQQYAEEYGIPCEIVDEIVMPE